MHEDTDIFSIVWRLKDPLASSAWDHPLEEVVSIFYDRNHEGPPPRDILQNLSNDIPHILRAAMYIFYHIDLVRSEMEIQQLHNDIFLKLDLAEIRILRWFVKNEYSKTHKGSRIAHIFPNDPVFECWTALNMLQPWSVYTTWVDIQQQALDICLWTTLQHQQSQGASIEIGDSDF